MIAKRIVLFLAMVGAGCESTVPVDWVATEVQASPTTLLAGDTVELTVRATNWGEEAVLTDNGCAPGLGFMVTRPDGVQVNPYPAAWPCGTPEAREIEPGETETVVFRWAAPDLTGDYFVVGGVVLGDRLWAVAQPTTFRVRID